MANRSKQSTSIWADTATPTVPSLIEDIATDVCIVGAGIAGLTTALLLAREGKSVVVLDDGPIGAGQTERTTAHLSNAIDDRYCEIERMHGFEGARLAAESHTAAIDRIEAIAFEEAIDCDFERVDGYLVLGDGHSSGLLLSELAAARRAGLEGLQYLSQTTFGGFRIGPALRFPRQGQFHPLRYLSGLAAAITRRGGRIFTGSHVDKISGGPSATVVTSGGSVVKAGAVVVATNTPINDLLAVHTKQAAYRSYVIAARVATGVIPRALFWDTLDPYHYVRLADVRTGMNGNGGRHQMLIVGGEDHKTGQSDDADDRYKRLEQWARKRFASMGEVEEHWSGQVMETIDGLAFIGRNPLDEDNVYIATGDSGMGMTHGTIAGMLITDLIMGRKNAWTELYDPSRKTLRAAKRFVEEASNMAWQYTHWLTAGDVSTPGEIPAGSGAVIRRGLAKIAIYRDEESALHEMSAVCPHLGGIVAWNSAENTWDCPCHGSRFDRFGEVLCGPAISALAPKDVDSDDEEGFYDVNVDDALPPDVGIRGI